jgi:cyclohexanecarboxyl-CoA dehydrogenase
MHAHTGLVLARTGERARGVSAFYVDLDERYVTRSAFDDLGSRSMGRAALHFDGLPVARDRLIGDEGSGFVSVMQGFDYSRAVIGLACLGAAQVSLEEACQWARDREAFGRPIGTFQGVAFPLAAHATYLRGARHLCYEALWRKDQGLEHGTEAAMAKFWAPRLATEVIHQCLLTFGHMGYSAENPLGQRLRDVIGLEVGDGTAQVSQLVISRGLLGRTYAP